MTDVHGERSTRQPEHKYAITRDQYDAVLFDLDGVITDTAGVHAAWNLVLLSCVARH